MPLTFSKDERLCSRKLIDRLYADGNRLMAFPYSVQWRAEGDTLNAPCQVLIVAPKRKFHHAVDRNHIRRLTRECWRHLKPSLLTFLDEHNLHITISLVYIHTEIMSYDQLLHKMEKLITSLQEDITKTLGHEAL